MGPPHLLHPQAGLAAPGGVELCGRPGAQGFPTLSLAVRTGASPGAPATPHLPLLRLWDPRSPGLPKEWRPSGKAASSPRIPVGPPAATSARERADSRGVGTRPAWASAQTETIWDQAETGTPSGHPGSGGHGGRGEAETMQREDRWAGTLVPAEVSPRQGQGDPAVIFGKGAAPLH